jgi:hypothetical protein
MGRNVLDRHENPVFAGVFCDQETVTGMHPAHDRRRVFSQLLVFGQIFGDADHIDRRSDKADHRQAQPPCRRPRSGFAEHFSR